MSRTYRGPSEAQANAEALARRGSPWYGDNHASVSVAWDYRRREPTDLRDAVRQCRRAYADEIPVKLHDGPDAIGPDGTPRFAARAEGYIFGSPGSSDAKRDPETGEWDAVSYYHAPFRATLDAMGRGSEADRRRGRIVSHVTIGQQGPVDAATAEGAHPLDAKLVAWDALRCFLSQLSDVKVDTSGIASQEGVTAA